MIYFTAMLTTPDFELSSKAIDFEYVPINCISKAIVRLENTREVPCEWKYVPKQNMNEAPNAPKDHERF